MILVSSENDWPIAILKGTHSTYNCSSHYTNPKSPSEALTHQSGDTRWLMRCFLQSNVTWELVLLLVGKSIIGCQWLYTLKTIPNGKIDHYKIHLVA